MIQTKYLYKILRPRIINTSSLIGFSFLLFFSSLLTAQEWEYPLIPGYGGIEYTDSYSEQFSPEESYRLLFDITSDAQKDGVNRGLWRVARTLNLLEACSVPREQIEIVVALHGAATKAVLRNEAYHSLYEDGNPNVKLIHKLADNRVEFFVCSQAMVGRSLPLDQVHPDITVALSALTVIINHQKKGFFLVP